MQFSALSKANFVVIYFLSLSTQTVTNLNIHNNNIYKYRYIKKMFVHIIHLYNITFLCNGVKHISKISLN